MPAAPQPLAAHARGIVLIAVLWICAMVSILATGFAYATRNEARLNAAVVDRARAAAAAEAGVQRLLVLLRKPPAAGAGMAPLQHYDLHFDGVDVQVAVASEAGRIDLNAAPPALIEGLLRRAAEAVNSLDGSRAQALAAAILDWRDADDRTRRNGAESNEYRALGRAGPRDQPFISVSELRQVAGIDREVYAFIAPLVSVASQSSRIDPRAAARDTLLAVPGLEAPQVDAYLASRTGGDSGASVAAVLKSSKYLLVRNRTRAFSINATARTESGVRALRRAVVTLNRNPAAPIAILDWSRFPRGLQPAPAPTGGRH